eukprot:9094121-Karenia_brevis.AAC.1
MHRRRVWGTPTGRHPWGVGVSNTWFGSPTQHALLYLLTGNCYDCWTVNLELDSHTPAGPQGAGGYM